MGVEEILKEKREEILRNAARHGAYNVRVFGSMARGDARADSDVDFLVDVGPNRSFFFPGGLVADLENLLGRHVDVASEGGLHSYHRQRVLEEAVLL
ncbi:MAG TPA: nucleotidyltransferase family protein [Terriglobia bacterium]|nr:nucleotidyltransferase family protein [Terriglobia bacterium]